MSLSHKYQEFGQPDFGIAAAMTDPDAGLEELKLDSYEDGYKAGWDDSIKAQGAEQESAASQIAQRLEDLTFTHAEAIKKMNAAMQPLLQKIVVNLLPDIAKSALPAHVQEQFEALIATHTQDAIEIAVAPENLDMLHSLLEGRVSTPFNFVAEPALTTGQVYLRTNCAEREINLDVVRDGITAALDAYYSQTLQEDVSHG